VGRERIEGLTFEPLTFDPPRADLHTLGSGVEVLHLRDTSLPLVSVFARFDGGYSHLPRAYFAAGTGLPALVRGGGTEGLPPDSVDALLELHAIQTVFGGGGQSIFASVNVLSRHLERGLELWGRMLRTPGFDSSRVEVWRGQELEVARRRVDNPASLAFSTFNHLMYGDHPVGWTMGPDDLEPSDVTPERLRWVHRRIMCPGNMVLGVTGDVTWPEIRPLLEELTAEWPACAEPLPPLPVATLRPGPGVFLLPRELDQSTVVMAHGVDLHQGDGPPYFASRIGNSILGSSGFSSRLMSRVRTEEGYAYSASSLWTAPRESPGLLGALTRTRSDRTLAATRLLLEILEEMRSSAPSREEVERTVADYANGFVFNFDSPAGIVARQMAYRTDGMPEDWLQRYLEGIQQVSPADVQEVFRRYLEPEDMVILVLGDPARFDGDLAELGPVTRLEPDGSLPDPAGPAAGRPGPR
jgi:zinc protease